MPRTTKTFDLEEERQRINEELDKLADEEAEDIKAQEADDRVPSGQHVQQERRQEARRLDQMLTGVNWALDPPEEEDVEPIEEVTLGALNAAEYGMVSDFTSNQVDSRSNDDRRGEQMKRVIFAAGGIVEAPFVDDGTRNSNIESKYQSVAQLAPQFVYWLEQRTDELTTPEVEGNGFAARVAERTTTEQPSTPSPEQS
ncbi:hypothetical protein DJ71_14975 [Halorubrum sp. E3]|nr:hypothetical protein DJ71_14975 [Halorubrum sp. E3]